MELFTACCQYSRLLLKDDEHKKIVLQSLAFLCSDQRIRLYGYVILEDEFHVLWEKFPAWKTKNIRQMMLKYTAQQIKHRLLRTRSPVLEEYRSLLNDRHYHFWDKARYFTPMRSPEMVAETIAQLHEAPVSSGLCGTPEEYPFSSAAFYHKKYHTVAPHLPGHYEQTVRNQISGSRGPAPKGYETAPAINIMKELSVPNITGQRLHVVKYQHGDNPAFGNDMDNINRDTALVRITGPGQRTTTNGKETPNFRPVTGENPGVKLLYKSLTAGNKNSSGKSGSPGLIALITRKTEEPLIITDFQAAFKQCFASPGEE